MEETITWMQSPDGGPSPPTTTPLLAPALLAGAIIIMEAGPMPPPGAIIIAGDAPMPPPGAIIIAGEGPIAIAIGG
jgi:hypothetical protein